jgi:hypothetical protein
VKDKKLFHMKLKFQLHSIFISEKVGSKSFVEILDKLRLNIKAQFTGKVLIKGSLYF